MVIYLVTSFWDFLYFVIACNSYLQYLYGCMVKCLQSLYMVYFHWNWVGRTNFRWFAIGCCGITRIKHAALIWERVCDDMYLIIAGTLTRVALSMCLWVRAERTISSGSTTGFSSTSRRRLETLTTMVTSDEKRWVCTVFTPWRHTIFIMKWLLMFIPVLFYFIHNFFIFITQGSFN